MLNCCFSLCVIDRLVDLSDVGVFFSHSGIHSLQADLSGADEITSFER